MLAGVVQAAQGVVEVADRQAGRRRPAPGGTAPAAGSLPRRRTPAIAPRRARSRRRPRRRPAAGESGGSVRHVLRPAAPGCGSCSSTFSALALRASKPACIRRTASSSSAACGSSGLQGADEVLQHLPWTGLRQQPRQALVGQHAEFGSGFRLFLDLHRRVGGAIPGGGDDILDGEGAEPAFVLAALRRLPAHCCGRKEAGAAARGEQRCRVGRRGRPAESAEDQGGGFIGQGPLRGFAVLPSSGRWEVIIPIAANRASPGKSSFRMPPAQLRLASSRNHARTGRRPSRRCGHEETVYVIAASMGPARLPAFACPRWRCRPPREPRTTTRAPRVRRPSYGKR